MAKGKKKGKFKSGIPLDEEHRILSMSPTDLAVEVTFERNAVEALKKQKKEHTTLVGLTADVKRFNDALSAEPEVEKAKAALEKAKEENTSNEHLEAKADLAAWNKGWDDDAKDRKKKLKYMEKMLQRHIESGALKRKP